MFYHFCFALLYVSACHGQILRNSPAITYPLPGNNLPRPITNNNPAPNPISNDSSFGRGLIDNGGLVDPNYGGEPIDGGILPVINEIPDINDPNDSGFGRDPNEITTESNEGPQTIDPNDSGLTVNDESTHNPIDPIDEGYKPINNDSGVLPLRDEVCQRRFGFYRIESKCDSYIECRNYRAAEKLCPDGMHFNPDAKWSEYPCGYPMDVPCLGRGSVQPPKPTAECPHQFGFYPVSDPSMTQEERCSQYIMCANGNAMVMDCPFGLAFNTANGRCDWPEQVPSCKNFLGFQCPDAPDGAPADDIVINYPYGEGECYYFWSCQSGRARVLSCDFGLAFDPNLGRCVEEDLVQCDNLDNHGLEPISETSSPGPVAPETEVPVALGPNDPRL